MMLGKCVHISEYRMSVHSYHAHQYIKDSKVEICRGGQSTIAVEMIAVETITVETITVHPRGG